MKKLVWLLFAMPLTVLAQNKSANFSITGTVKGLKDKSVVSLTDGNKTTDTLVKTVVSGGVFKLTGHLEEPNLYILNFDGAKKKYPVFIGKDQIQVTGEIENLKDLNVKGSSSQDDFTEFQKIFNPLMMRLSTLGQMLNSQQYNAKNDSLMKEYTGLNLQIQNTEDQFIQNRKSSFVSPFIILVLSQLSETSQLEQRFNMLSPEVQNGFFGKYLKEQIDIAKIGEVGTDALDFTQNDTSGNAVRLSSFRGKYVLVDFWASWCNPCRMENPNVVEAFNKFKNKNFTILGVSLDKARGPWLQAIKDDHLTWTQVSDLKFWNNEVAVKYHIQQIPQNMLIGPDGKIVAKNLRGQDLESKLCELLGCN